MAAGHRRLSRKNGTDTECADSVVGARRHQSLERHGWHLRGITPRRLSPQGVFAVVKTYADKLNILAGPHDLRRSFASSRTSASHRSNRYSFLLDTLLWLQPRSTLASSRTFVMRRVTALDFYLRRMVSLTRRCSRWRCNACFVLLDGSHLRCIGAEVSRIQLTAGPEVKRVKR